MTSFEQLQYDDLLKRIGASHLNKRLKRQILHTANIFSKGKLYLMFHLEQMDALFIIFKWILKFLGHYDRGRSNTMDYTVQKVIIPLKNLPREFDGFKILQLSDLHSDSIPDKGVKLSGILRSIHADLCVLTGDFRTLTHDVYVPSLLVTQSIISSIKSRHGIYGVLGNHDFIEFVTVLEYFGVGMLLNEAIAIQKNNSRIWLSGVDDAHMYKTDDVEKAMKNIPENEISIMLSHTPSIYQAAEKKHVNYLICGHTHGGQICLPGGIPLITHGRCPRKFTRGLWRYKALLGYTSKGTGTAGLAVRFMCPPEITIHEMRRIT